MIFRRLCKYIMLPVAVICFLSSSLVSYAQTQTYSLTLKFITESGVVEDCEFNLYYALTPDGKLYGDFAELNVEVGSLTDAENVNRLAETLAAYAESGITNPTATEISDALGHTDFKGLSAGIYLVIGKTAILENSLYVPKPALIRVPDSSGGNVVADIKYLYTPIVEETMSRTVVKQWEDQNDPSRPKSVTVQLLQDGNVYGEAVLSSDNNWTYTWNDLDVSFDWTVIETSVPDGYSVSVVLNDEIFTVVNKKNGASDVTDEPPAENTTSTTHEQTKVDNDDDSNNRPSLPYTGQWWLPVPILFVAGLILFLISLISERLSDEDEKK